MIEILLICSLERNSRISIRRSDAWALKGRFNNAIRIREPLAWVYDDLEEAPYIEVFAENDPLAPQLIPAPSIAPQPSPSKAASMPSDEVELEESFQTQLVNALSIPPSLATRPKIVDVRLAYAKYKAFHQAQLEHYQMVADGTWVLKSPSNDELIEVFVSKSVWYTNYVKVFPVAKTHPLLFEWLEKPYDVVNGNDNASELNVAVFGVDKSTYTFNDLKMAVATLEKAREKKGKGKRKAESNADEGKKAHKKLKKASTSRF